MCARSRASLSSHPGPQLTQAPAASRALEWWRPGHFTASPLRLIRARAAQSRAVLRPHGLLAQRRHCGVRAGDGRSRTAGATTPSRGWSGRRALLHRRASVTAVERKALISGQTHTDSWELQAGGGWLHLDGLCPAGGPRFTGLQSRTAADPRAWAATSPFPPARERLSGALTSTPPAASLAQRT